MNGAESDALLNLKPFPEWISTINPYRVEARCDRRPFHRRDDCRLIAETRLRLDAADEAAADIAFMDEAITDREFVCRGEMREAR